MKYSSDQKRAEHENQKQAYAKKSVKSFQPDQPDLSFENNYALKAVNQELRELRDHEGHLKLPWYRNQFGRFYEVRSVDDFWDKHRQAETLRNVCTRYCHSMTCCVIFFPCMWIVFIGGGDCGFYGCLCCERKDGPIYDFRQVYQKYAPQMEEQSIINRG